MTYVIEDIEIFNSETGLNTLGFYSVLSTTGGKTADKAQKEFREFYSKLPKQPDWASAKPFKHTKDFTEFLDYLVDLVAKNTPTGLQTLSDVDTVLMKKIPTFKAVKYIMLQVSRSVLLATQKDSRYGATTPILLYALKKAGYPYMYWDINDRLLPEYLGTNPQSTLKSLIQFRKSQVLIGRLKSAIQTKYEASKIAGRPWKFMEEKGYPHLNTVEKTLSRELKLDITPPVVAIYLKFWVNLNNPNNIGIGIYNLENWDYEPEYVKVITQEVEEQSPWI